MGLIGVEAALSLSKWRDTNKVIKFSDVLSGVYILPDIQNEASIDKTLTGLINHMSDNELTKAEILNIIGFLGKINKDLGLSFHRKICSLSDTGDRFFSFENKDQWLSDDDAYNFLKNHFGLVDEEEKAS
jgi:hypothetical protein